MDEKTRKGGNGRSRPKGDGSTWGGGWERKESGGGVKGKEDQVCLGTGESGAEKTISSWKKGKGQGQHEPAGLGWVRRLTNTDKVLQERGDWSFRKERKFAVSEIIISKNLRALTKKGKKRSVEFTWGPPRSRQPRGEWKKSRRPKARGSCLEELSFQWLSFSHSWRGGNAGGGPKKALGGYPRPGGGGLAGGNW